MTRILVAKAVSRAARKEKITDETLVAVAIETEKGTYRADLGDETYKVSIARPGRGKSHGYRAILGLRPKHRALFAFLWSKNEFENINDEYLAAMKVVIKGVMELDDAALQSALESEVFREIIDNNAKVNEHGGRQDES